MLGFSVLLVLATFEWRSARRQEALLQVLAVPAQRELENFEVSLDGTIIAREPNGDVIEMSPPGWKGWLKKVEKDGAQRELENYEVALDGNIIAREPNGDVIEMSPPAWREWHRCKTPCLGPRGSPRSPPPAPAWLPACQRI